MSRDKTRGNGDGNDQLLSQRIRIFRNGQSRAEEMGRKSKPGAQRVLGSVRARFILRDNQSRPSPRRASPGNKRIKGRRANPSTSGFGFPDRRKGAVQDEH